MSTPRRVRLDAPPKDNLRWKQDEINLIHKLWGDVGLKDIATQLGRTWKAVSEKVRKLGLGKVNRGRVSVYTIEREYGYDRERIQKAMRHLNIRPRAGLVGTTCSSDKKSERRKFIPEESVEKLLAFLAKFPDGQRLYDPRGKKTGRMMWGTGGKPPACIDCKRTDRPHAYRGLCNPCASKRNRITKMQRLADQTAAMNA